MFKPKDSKERIQHRLKISLGHLKKVIVMVEDDSYCIDILHQSQAVQNALKETDHVILENHLNTCVSEEIKNGNKTEVIKEVMEILRKSR
jgi:CsoR family transcriptional regulator, copper-sensing transcriptional repressor